VFPGAEHADQVLGHVVGKAHALDPISRRLDLDRLEGGQLP
jgi:hypothetical protein